ncbi:MAG TPA: hypothetical protein VGS57_09490 [Thermoanaerobaculia bacterium]|jgi:hypothetical protein|nr:hypothetical protein [Thermoanaerobaculia bacterium]
MADNALRAAIAVVDILRALDLDYVIGGSIASSIHGIARSTRDVDIVVALPPNRVPDLVAALRGSFYVDDEMAAEAVARAGSFNVIHLESMFKVDLFVLGPDAMSRAELARRQRHRIAEDGAEVFVASAEDTVLQKLLWYRKGNEVSDRQWLDVIEVLRIQGARLDRAYLATWARALAIDDLLAEAVSEAAGD